ncbi:UvrABC system protein C [Desulfovibrio sp. X2]|uniref:excinuclease ABC subunit UvrC n=1 Tax=Desulfovibrio sp. X2 TaxID=941449 RepID=UPI000358D97C|nr:excinuclease ABC subunit UvrC [Desulfovibrio sp. X2]EPR37415.1 UvrABC system protein C [Desulfovibrio sp. X2]
MPPSSLFRPDEFSESAGVYLMKDAKGRILYVGKAKSLRRRLASYFRSPEDLAPKTRALMARVLSIDTLLTATEKEALLLENSLIKKHRPRYNILLRDDKQYLLFKLTKQTDYPRLTVARKAERDGAAYFGPFTSATDAKETWRLIGRVFPLRKCTDRTLHNRVRPCLYHYIGQCLAPCVNDVPRDEYAGLVEKVEMLLGGRSEELIRDLEARMREASAALAFERAAILRDQVRAVRRTLERQATVLPGGGDLDAAAVAPAAGGLGLCLLFVRQGRMIGQKTFFWPDLGPEDGPEAVAAALVQFYGPERLIPGLVLLPWPIEDETVEQVLAERRGAGISLRPPRSTVEKQLLDMARRNAAQAAPRQDQPGLAEALARALHMAEPPGRIECVDVSHLQGEATRAGHVVFLQGEPARNENRAYALDDTGGDDYRALGQWTERRLVSGPPWPDLVLIDGGRGQLEAVRRSLAEAGQEGLFALASIAKAGRRAGELGDQIFLPGRKNPLPLRPGSPEMLFLQRLRDAAHAFVIGRQRRARRSGLMQSELLSLPGIGPKTAKLLWDNFASVEEMLAASEADLAAVPGLGRKKARVVHAALQSLHAGG